MNKLILIGNGFDLAHGLKTSYHDFIKWYFLKCLQDCVDRKETSELLSVTFDRRWGYQITPPELLVRWTTDCFKDEFDTSKIGHILNNGDIRNPFVLKFSSELMHTLLKQAGGGRWVDIEGVFYERLVWILNNCKTDQSTELALKQLNKSMHLIIKELQVYLSSMKQPEKIKNYSDIIYAEIDAKDIQSKRVKIRTGMNYRPDSRKEILLLNFNYTDTATFYLNPAFKNDSYKPTKQIFIHGQLNHPKNPIIFGFGDEVDRRYEDIENSRAKGWFEYIKSFWYLKTNNYRDLTAFIDSEDYQVVVLGHSCGLSDRTMLQMIFQHDNCRSIKLYYHGNKETNNHTETLHEVARHFKDKGLMRRRIVSEENSERMPQFND